MKLSGNSAFRAGLRAAVLLCAVMASPLWGQCGRSLQTSSPVSVYESPPTFSSGRGWTLGTLIAQLPAGTPVAICEELRSGLFFDKKTWFRINFANGRVGWAYAGEVIAMVGDPGVPRFSIELIAQAHAQAAAQSSGLPGFFSKGSMILTAGLFVLLGIIGKVVSDEVEKPGRSSWRNCLQPRKFVKALIAAPLAFAAFLNIADFSFPSEVAVAVFFCMAFQNGFFWQTLVPTARAGVVALPN